MEKTYSCRFKKTTHKIKDIPVQFKKIKQIFNNLFYKKFHWGINTNTYPAIQVRRKSSDTPWLDLVRKLVMIWGISATPQQTRLTIPNPNDNSSLRLHKQSLKYLLTHPTHGLFCWTQYDSELVKLLLLKKNFIFMMYFEQDP